MDRTKVRVPLLDHGFKVDQQKKVEDEEKRMKFVKEHFKVSLKDHDDVSKAMEKLRKGDKNLRLVTCDDISMEVHKEVIVCQSNFFYSMWDFGGREVAEYKAEGLIRLEKGTIPDQGFLKILIDFYYDGELKMGSNMYVLHLLQFSNHYNEQVLKKKVLDKFWSLEMKKEEMISIIAFGGHLVYSPNSEEGLMKLVLDRFFQMTNTQKSEIILLLEKSTNDTRLREMDEEIQNLKEEDRNLKEENKNLTTRVDNMEKGIDGMIEKKVEEILRKKGLEKGMEGIIEKKVEEILRKKGLVKKKRKRRDDDEESKKERSLKRRKKQVLVTKARTTLPDAFGSFRGQTSSREDIRRGLAGLADFVRQLDEGIRVNCPFSQFVMHHPMKNRNCGHHYSKKGVETALGRGGRVICPEVGCNAPVTRNALTLNRDLQMKIQRKLENERKLEYNDYNDRNF